MYTVTFQGGFSTTGGTIRPIVNVVKRISEGLRAASYLKPDVCNGFHYKMPGQYLRACVRIRRTNSGESQ
jgi:hypothetical protein